MSKDRHPLHPLITDVQRKVGRIREDLKKIRAEIIKIRDLVERGFENVHDAIYDNIEAQAELKLMERMAEVRSLPPRIEAEQKRIEREKSENTEKLDTVSKRYQRRHDELDQKAAQRVRDLGEHIFTILEDEFEDDIESPFVDGVTPTWEEFKEHNTQVAIDRNSALWDSYENANGKIDQFLTNREGLINKIQAHRLDLNTTITEPATLQIPFWVVGIESEGKKETTIYGPSQLVQQDGGWFAAKLDEIESVDESLERQLRQPLDQAHQLSLSTSDLTKNIKPYANTRFGGVIGFEDEFEAAITNGTKIRVEGE